MTKKYFRGDTIVEVLLAIAITSAVLAGAYVATDRSLRVGRDAQERSEALEIAEGQLERLKSLSVTPVPGSDIFSGPTQFCIASNLAITSIPPADFTNPEAYPASCRASNLYSFGIERTTTGSDSLYTVRVLWPSVSGTVTSVVNGTNLPGFSEIKVLNRVQRP